MSSNATAGVGTHFRRWGGNANPNWVNIAEINSIAGPNKTRDTIDVTSLDSTGGYREFIGGFRDGGTVTLPMNFTRSTYDTMNNDYESDLHQHYEIMLPDVELTSFEFVGLVTELGLAVPVDDKITADVTIKVSGAVVINSKSGSGEDTSELG
jgi:predicted secreted protein